MTMEKRSRLPNDKSIGCYDWRECCSLSSIIDGQCVSTGRWHTLHSGNSISFRPWSSPNDIHFKPIWCKIGKRFLFSVRDFEFTHTSAANGPQWLNQCSVYSRTKTKKRKRSKENEQMKLYFRAQCIRNLDGNSVLCLVRVVSLFAETIFS